MPPWVNGLLRINRWFPLGPSAGSLEGCALICAGPPSPLKLRSSDHLGSSVGSASGKQGVIPGPAVGNPEERQQDSPGPCVGFPRERRQEGMNTLEGGESLARGVSGATSASSVTSASGAWRKDGHVSDDTLHLLRFLLHWRLEQFVHADCYRVLQAMPLDVKKFTTATQGLSCSWTPTITSHHSLVAPCIKSTAHCTPW